MRSKFGWDLPPGVTQRHIDEAFGGDEGPCQCCGSDPADCLCTECQACGEQGNPNCYKPWPEGGHGKVYTNAQRIGQAKMRIALYREKIQDEEMFVAYMESHPEEDPT